MISNRSIVHMDLDTFFVSCERLMDSRLNNKPILIGGTSDRGVVASCSYETRAFGVHAGMPMRLAKSMCPEALVIHGNHSLYSQCSHVVTDIIRQNVPLYEKSSIDEFYIDLTGMDKFFGVFKLATELRQKIIKESGLPISFGLSQNKTVSKIATGEAKPNNQLKIDFGNEKHFLAPLSVKKIPMIGDKTYQTLRNLGVFKIKTLQDMPVELVQHVFGVNGTTIWQKANGIDNSPVEPYSERKSISTERTFEQDTIDIVMLESLLTAMTEHLAFSLRKENKLTACISVKIRYSDFNTVSQQLKIPYTSADHILIPIVKGLFHKLYNRRLLIRLIGVRFSHLVGGNYQINLFEDTVEAIRLYQAIDKVKRRFGTSSLVRAEALNIRNMRFGVNPFGKGDAMPDKTDT